MISQGRAEVTGGGTRYRIGHCLRLACCDDAVADFSVLLFRNSVACHQVMRVLEWTIGNDPAGLTLGQAGQAQQIFARGAVDVDRLLVPHPFLHALGHRLGIASHGLCGFSRAPTDFIWIIPVICASGEADQRQAEDKNSYPMER